MYVDQDSRQAAPPRRMLRPATSLLDAAGFRLEDIALAGADSDFVEPLVCSGGFGGSPPGAFSGLRPPTGHERGDRRAAIRRGLVAPKPSRRRRTPPRQRQPAGQAPAAGSPVQKHPAGPGQPEQHHRYDQQGERDHRNDQERWIAGGSAERWKLSRGLPGMDRCSPAESPSPIRVDDHFAAAVSQPSRRGCMMGPIVGGGSGTEPWVHGSTRDSQPSICSR
jgi:hypothetical protein